MISIVVIHDTKTPLPILYRAIIRAKDGIQLPSGHGSSAAEAIGNLILRHPLHFQDEIKVDFIEA